jgi:hypothetical protein
LAAVQSEHKSLAFQQLAVSHAAHDSLAWLFHGTRLYAAVDASLKGILGPIGINATSPDGAQAARVGRTAALQVAYKRTDDKIANFVDYVYGPKNIGIYQLTPGGAPLPDTPQAVFLRPFGGVRNISHFRAPPPPPVSDRAYEAFVQYVKDQGELNSTVRKPFDTDTAYFWRESSIMLVYTRIDICRIST